MNRHYRNILAAAGILVVIYSVVVLGFVVTSPDIRLRWLISDSVELNPPHNGVQIWTIDGLEYLGEKPQSGDILLEVTRKPINTYLDLAAVMLELYDPPEYPGEQDLVVEHYDPSEHPKESVPPIVRIHNGPRLAEIEYLSRADPENPVVRRSWVAMDSLPWQELVPTIVWFLIQLSVFAVAALAFWNRPFDRSTQMFYIVCMFGMGAFVGGFHWWMIGGSFFLNAPFIVMALYLPAVVLHFFLVYPRPPRFFSEHRVFGLTMIYALPTIAMVATFGSFHYLKLLNSQLDPVNPDPQLLDHIRDVLTQLSDGIWGYLVLAGGYFLGTVVSLAVNWARAANKVERMQLMVMLIAGIVATVPIGWSIYLAHFDRVGFAMGHARIPMFLASLLFQLAFVIGITRYKLMLAEQFVTRGAVYYLSSIGLTIGFACLIATVTLMALHMKIALSTFQYAAVVGLFIIAMIILLGVRDRLQESIDRLFYREKYQLDTAIRRMQNAVSQFADLNSLAEMMFGVCREVLQVDSAALYLRMNDSNTFERSALEGKLSVPVEVDVTNAILMRLQATNSFHRQPTLGRADLEEDQNWLRAMKAQVAQAVEMDGKIRGFLILGEKRNSTAYSAEDYAFLQALSQITNIGLHSLRAQDEMVHLNEQMQSKIDRIGEQSRQIALLRAELESIRSGTETAERETVPGLLSREKLKGNSPAIEHVMQMVSKVSRSESSVLVRGESGTGKELLAEILHDNSARRDRPLVKVHCAALSSNLLESELFGHVKGAFTGAHQDKQGRFAAADGGTIFLDEIGDISLETQVKLLRVLQARSFEPVGSGETVHVDVRLVTATHQSLEQLISEGRFREDLYYRLNVISLTLPALRERPEDIIELSVHFLSQSADRLGKRLRLSDEVVRLLEQYHWPGNVRQLQNVIERAAVLADGEVIRLNDLPREVLNNEPSLPRRSEVLSGIRETSAHNPSARPHVPHAAPPDHSGRSWYSAESDERSLLLDALERSNGNKAEAARLLDMPRSTFYSKLKKYLD